MKTINKIAIANRGEVASRIHRTCKKLGIKTVLLHSEADVKTKAYRECDETFCIGPASVQQSYLNINSIIEGALKSKANAIHPGFGFLSENSEFSAAVQKAGLIFIGPSADVIKSFGDKINAKEMCSKADVPLIPGFQNKNADLETLVGACEKIGFPVLVKAAAGGGGRGMRLILNKEMALNEIQSAQNEALKAFGDSTVFLEKYLNNSKHIEIQVFGDANGKIHILGERECSVQRKHQKIIEETPSPSLTDQQRQEVWSYAKRLCELGQYKSAGTVEFMFQDNQFYFLEVNTRLQVEHTVTEEVLGIDLVEAQILTAEEKPYPFPSQIKPKGHSIELRLYAEDPYNQGRPSTGVLGKFHLPEGRGRRFEVGIEEKDDVTPYYDSMIAKLISTQNTRIEAISDLVEVLKDMELFGVQSNVPLLYKILNHSDFILGHMTTRFFEENFSASLKPQLDEQQILKLQREIQKALNFQSSTDSSNSPWSKRWRTENLYSGSNNDLKKVKFQGLEKQIWWKYNLDTYKFLRKLGSQLSNQKSKTNIFAPMPGSIFKVLCAPGESVLEGQSLIVLEAMKMEHTLKSSLKGKVKAVHFKPGDTVQGDELLIEITPLT